MQSHQLVQADMTWSVAAGSCFAINITDPNHKQQAATLSAAHLLRVAMISPQGHLLEASLRALASNHVLLPDVD
jgi:hypothetical protein